VHIGGQAMGRTVQSTVSLQFLRRYRFPIFPVSFPDFSYLKALRCLVCSDPPSFSKHLSQLTQRLNFSEPLRLSEGLR
jgi:hypothetical protein